MFNLKFIIGVIVLAGSAMLFNKLYLPGVSLVVMAGVIMFVNALRGEEG